MIILKKTADDFLGYMISYTNDFDEKARKKVLSRNFEDLIHNFNSKVDGNTIYIECVENEVDSLLTDYICKNVSRIDLAFRLRTHQQTNRFYKRY